MSAWTMAADDGLHEAAGRIESVGMDVTAGPGGRGLGVWVPCGVGYGFPPDTMQPQLQRIFTRFPFFGNRVRFSKHSSDSASRTLHAIPHPPPKGGGVGGIASRAISAT